MFDVSGKVRAFLAGAVVIGTTVATPVLAADHHGQGGNVFYRGGHGAFHHGMQDNGFAGRGADGRNFAFRGAFPHRTMGRSRFEHRGFGNDGGDRRISAQNITRHGGYPFDRGNGNNHFRANHPRFLASRDLSMRRGSGISVISRNQPDYDSISNYSGSVDIYHANGGTYISGYGDGGGQQDSNTTMRPRAKIIDVARMHNSCAFENGVCVIRP